MSARDETEPGAMRIDRWLFGVRLFKSRSSAADAVGGGRVHLNGERVKPSHGVEPGDTGSFSLAELRRLPSRTQITKHTCEEGWSAIAEWTGVPLYRLLEAVGVLPGARFVNFYAPRTSINFL